MAVIFLLRLLLRRVFGPKNLTKTLTKIKWPCTCLTKSLTKIKWPKNRLTKTLTKIKWLKNVLLRLLLR